MDPNDPWALPAPPTKGDDDTSTIFQSIGEALSYWEWAEGYLGLIFAELVAPGQNPLAASRAYGTIVAFQGRADMVRSAAEAYFATRQDAQAVAIQARLAAHMKLLGRASPRRNDIAHGIVQPFSNLGGPNGYALFPSYYTSRRRDLLGVPSYIMSSVEIGRFGKQFAALKEPLDEVVEALWSRRRRV
jgi:hypothetical protein